MSKEIIRKLRIITLWAAKITLWGLALVFGVRCLIDPNYHKYGGVLAGIGLPFLPLVINKILKVKIPFRFELFYYFFVLIALDFGICLDFYKVVPFFDKIVHTLSGVGTGLIGFYVLKFFKVTTLSRLFRGLFVVFFSISIGVGWEFFEFFCDKCLGQSMQQLISVGVDDTMYDLLCATVGSILGAFLMTSRKVKKYLEG